MDSHGRSQFGRFLNVKPDVGVLTSTARTFIQEGVTTEYATQVVGTTLDNGRLYAHLLTKNSRVLYDNDAQSRSPNFEPNSSPNKWHFDQHLVGKGNFVKNTDYISPNQVDSPFVVFPTSAPLNAIKTESKELSDEELLQEPSNNPRVPFEEAQKESRTFSVSSGSGGNNNVKVIQINAQHRHIDLHQPHQAQRLVLDSDENDVIRKDELGPSKVREWDNLPTFTVRNEFSPSGFSFLGDLPDFDVNTERSKQTTAAERRAKLLFKGGIPNKQDLKTVTYTGFADFTTTVGDTVIVFTPQTSEPSKPTTQMIRPTSTLHEPPIATRVKTFLNHEPGVVTETVEGHKLTMEKSLATMVVDTTPNGRMPKQQLPDETAKTPTLPEIKTTSGSTIIFSSETIEPSESQIPMLSTPSDEDIAKIFASLQAKAAQEATEPLNTPSTIFIDDATMSTSAKPLGGATTIFFDDDEYTENTAAIQNTAVLTTTPRVIPIPKETSQEETSTEDVEESLEKQTTENVPTTTFKAEITTNEIAQTTIEQEAITTEAPPETTTLSKENEDESANDSQECKDGLMIVPTTSYKTLTYLTTFFIPGENSETSTSIKSNQVVSTEVKKETRACISATSTIENVLSSSEITTTTESSEIATEQITEAPESESTTTEAPATTTAVPEEENENGLETTTTESSPNEITTERRHVTESEPETTEMTTENGEEIELLFKTLYTTYTYLTTYFQESSSSVASRKTVVTNVITSTIDSFSPASEDPIASLINSNFKSKPVTFEDFAEIAPSGVGIGRPTALPDGVTSPNPEELDAVLSESSKATPALSDKNVLNTVNAIKTYYTTYTYFTTIFVDGETEISSRTEVYTNYVTPTTSPEEITATPTVVLDQEEMKSKITNLNLGKTGNYNSTINRHKSIDNNIENDILSTSALASDSKSQSSAENDLLDLSDYETISTMVTDVRSSTSQGEKRILDSDKRNVLLDDQIVSESNNESEIIPSPTLLLQTSYTTFTYFTTMYQGTTSSNIVSRLETITNVVTETLTPTHTLSVEDLSLPITYFTTFTYWTTLYKEGTTKVTSREETVSNVVTPTPGENVMPTTVSEIQATSVLAPVDVETTKIASMESVNPIIPLDSSEKIEAAVKPTKELNGDDDQTTYYTTYTYYTTSYVGNATILNSRLETVTNVVNKTAELDNAIGRAIGQGILNTLDSGKDTNQEVKPTGLLSTIRSTVDNSGTQTVLSTDVYGTYIDGLYAKVLESTSIIAPSRIEEDADATVSSPALSSTSTSSAASVEEKLKPTGVVSINQGQIVDADGISTLFYTTKAVGTYIDNLYAQVIESTSSFKVDDEKKAILTEQPPAHRTGLVRLIEGSIVHSHTTTVYQSKVLGTVIDGRYAQIIESTSSFIIAPTISPTATQSVQVTPSATISPSPVVIEGSISDSSDVDDSTENPDDDENSTEDSEGRVKSRLTFQSRKRTFTPVIRPFASRAKPTFAPKRKGSKAGSATTITRSDFTPTVTAIPATKSGSRFGGGRKSSSLSSIVPSASGSRRFTRPRSSSAVASGGLSSTFSPNRGRSSARIQPTASVFGSSTRRTGGFRSSAISSAPIRPSSSFNANNRFSRVRPTSVFNANRNANSVTLPSTASDEENDLTTQVTDDPSNVDENETTTAALETTSTRRNANPLLRFRRPPLSRPTSAPRSTTTKAVGNSAVGRTSSGRSGRVTTTQQPKTTRTPSRNIAISSRARPANSLFPRRNLFTTTTTAEPGPEEDEEQEDLADETENNGNEDTEFEGTDTNTQTEKVPSPVNERKSRANSVLIKPFTRKRSKRQTNFSRFRRPTSRTTPAPVEVEPETEPPRSRSRYTGYNSRSRTTPAPRIIPSKPSTRSQFTLRDTSNSRSSNFRRPSTVSSNLRKPTSRPSSRQSSLLRNSNTERTTNSNSNKSRKSSSRRRGSTRGKVTDIDSNYVLPGADGTITVTHQIPTEVTIPVVNGKITEYKNIVTAKLSTEVLSPKQYSTTINPFGKDVTILLSESTGFAANGAQQVTKFTLNESPTTTVIFTPTYIRGRKTSFSHVIPSTVYIVDPIVNTLTPALPQAPLANILLSQLLLGQQQANPLLGLQQPGAVAGSPTTEFKTRTTTYVTTVTSETSTVIPLTFRGKEILTTIIDSSTNVVTATEFITDTVVVTPTPVLQQNQQLNSLLVPLLLQQQQQQQQQQISPLFQQQNPAGVINANSNEDLFKKALFQESEQTKHNLALDEEGDINEDYQNVDDVTEAPRKPSRANKLTKPKKPPAPETSVITLYVSGRTPGEFSTVLSTVVVGEDNKKKREATYVPVQPSKILDDLVISTLEYVDTYVMPAMDDVVLDHSEPTHTYAPTESLESILGDVSKQMVSDTPERIKPTKPGSMVSKKYKQKYVKVGGDQLHGNFLAL